VQGFIAPPRKGIQARAAIAWRPGQEIEMKPRLDIRALRPDERYSWEPLWQGYLTFYRSAVAPEVTDSTWDRLHDPAEPMHVLGAFFDGTLVGIVHYLFHRSTWTIGDYCYLQDLYTAPEARGQGAGRALIEAVYDRAEVAGASRVYWLTQETNATARTLYDTLADRPGFIQYRHVV
jgi:GNAT superfamily N-acetyltransferase